jgi:hypothetical protein
MKNYNINPHLLSLNFSTPLQFGEKWEKSIVYMELSFCTFFSSKAKKGKKKRRE